MARASKKDQAKHELAARLGVPVEDILTREQVADEMAPKTTTGWIEKNSDASPPFFSKGDRHIALYPRAWVAEFVATGKVMGTSGRLQGRQSWPPAPPSPPPVDEGKRQRARDLLDDVHAIAQPPGTPKDEDHWVSVSEGEKQPE